MSDSFLEQDLYPPVKAFFQAAGYEVKAENNHCDVTAKKGDVLLVVELKKNLSLDLLVQGVKRQKVADLVYVAVPMSARFSSHSRFKDVLNLMRRLELGLLVVTLDRKKPRVDVLSHPEPFDLKQSRRLNKQRRSDILEEFQNRRSDYNQGGSSGKKILTVYRQSAIYIAACLAEKGPLSPKQLRGLGTDPKKCTSILYQNFYGWFERRERGLYDLTETGKRDLENYTELYRQFQEEIAQR